MTGFKRFCDIMDVPPEEEADNAIKAGVLKGEIEFQNVTFGYRNDDGSNKVIKDFSIPFAYARFVSFGQTANIVVDVGFFSRLRNLFVSGVEIAVSNIFFDSAVE